MSESTSRKSSLRTRLGWKTSVVVFLLFELLCPPVLVPRISADEKQIPRTPKPICARAEVKFEFAGRFQEYLANVTQNWLLTAPERNPALLEMFADRAKKPPRLLLPWSGEFAGKYLTGAVQIWRLTRNPQLKSHLEDFVRRLLFFQAEDGYLGPWSKEYQLTGEGDNVAVWPNRVEGFTWDAWNHYHIMLGLLLWQEETDSPEVLHAVEKIGDLLCRTFLGRPGSLAKINHSEMNLAPVHSLALLYKKTGQPKYLDLALQIVNDEFPAAVTYKGKPGNDYLQETQAGKEFYQFPNPRWECLHSLLGLAELYWITGEDNYRRTFEHIWWSIMKTDVHNTGAFSSDECALGNPYHRGAIETCCVIAFDAMTVEMLRMTGNSIAADHLELSLMNAVWGFQSRDGRWTTYKTPMDGHRKPNTVDIGFMQKRAGSEEFNCCSANAPRGLGLVSEWALMQYEQALALNYYGPVTLTSRVNGVRLSLHQQTDYPRNGAIHISISPEQPVSFTLKLRIPFWSPAAQIKVNGARITGVKSGAYQDISRVWKKGDTIEINLDMSLHFWAGEREYEGRASIYRGPVLLAYQRLQGADDVPKFDAAVLKGTLRNKPDALVALEVTDVRGACVTLLDFDTAGDKGQEYVSWFETAHVPKVTWSQANPLRSARLK